MKRPNRNVYLIIGVALGLGFIGFGIHSDNNLILIGIGCLQILGQLDVYRAAGRTRSWSRKNSKNGTLNKKA